MHSLLFNQIHPPCFWTPSSSFWSKFSRHHGLPKGIQSLHDESKIWYTIVIKLCHYPGRKQVHPKGTDCWNPSRHGNLPHQVKKSMPLISSDTSYHQPDQLFYLFIFGILLSTPLKPQRFILQHQIAISFSRNTKRISVTLNFSMILFFPNMLIYHQY